MNSLHKFYKNSPSEEDGYLRPYCFPNVLNEKEKNSEGLKEKYIFRKFDDGVSTVGGTGTEPNSFNKKDKNKSLKEGSNTLEKEAYAVGFEKGEKDGLRMVRERLETVIHNFKEAVFQIQEVDRQIRVQAEEEIIRLAVAIAEKIIHHEIHANKEVILNILSAALKKVNDHNKIKIRLNAKDLTFIKEADPEMLEFQNTFESITFEEDPSVTGGGCVIETGLGDIDARIEKQIHAIQQGFETEISKLRKGDAD